MKPKVRLLLILTLLTELTLGGLALGTAEASEFIVYSVYKGLDFGNPGETPQKDFYVNMGSAQGVRKGSLLEVSRKIATYDVTSQKLYKDLTFPIATLKVIHVEGNAAVARLERINEPESTPAITPRAVLVGDAVRIAE